MIKPRQATELANPGRGSGPRPRREGRRRIVPEVTIQLAEGRTLEQKRALVKGLTDAVVNACGVDAESVIVVIHENPKTDKAKGGVLFCDR
jgi:4-oxalocrotonate tautomerase